MPKFKVKQRLIQTVIQVFWEEFDTDDQAHWELLKKRVSEDPYEDFDDVFPDKAPTDPSIWFELYQNLYYSEYNEQDEDDWYSDREGYTQRFFDLEDSDGDLIKSTEQ